MKTLKCKCGKDIQVEDWHFLVFERVPLSCIGRNGVYYDIWEDGKRTVTNLAAYILGTDDGQLPDHKDGDFHNNLISNLRIATPSQNQANKGPNKNNTTGFKGVKFCWWKKDRQWRWSVDKDGVRYSGYCQTAESAAKCRDRKAIELFGEFAWTNFPKSSYENVNLSDTQHHSS